MTSDSSHIWIFLTKYFRNWCLLRSSLLPPFWCFYQNLHLDTLHLFACLSHLLHKVFCLWPLALSNLAEKGAKCLFHWSQSPPPFFRFLLWHLLAQASDHRFVLVVTLQDWYFRLGPLAFSTWPVICYKRDDKRWGPSLRVCLSCHNRKPEKCILSLFWKLEDYGSRGWQVWFPLKPLFLACR